MDDPEVHSGYEFEEGMFARVRCWVDLLPWVRLTRVPRILASPAYVGSAALAWAVSAWAFVWCFQQSLTEQSLRGQPLTVQSLWPSGSAAGVLVAAMETTTWATTAGYVLFLFVVWVPVVQLVARGGAGLAAGAGLPNVAQTCGVVRARLLKSYAVPVLPWLCAVALAVAVFAAGVPGWLGWQPLSWVAGTAVGLLSIPLGILLFGALIAVPLALAAMVCEPQPDAIDALSRGYEALFRRPLHLVGYLLVGGVMWIIARLLLGGVCVTAQAASDAILAVVAADAVQRRAAAGIIETVYCGWQITLLCGWLGGAYLLLRHDTGGQEIEELWHPPPQPPADLPELPEQAYRS